jgi:hypothetical protein
MSPLTVIDKASLWGRFKSPEEKSGLFFGAPHRGHFFLLTIIKSIYNIEWFG